MNAADGAYAPSLVIRHGSASPVRSPGRANTSANEDLIRRAQRRDEEATSLLYQMCYPKVFQYCRARLVGFDAASDAASGVIEKMLRALPSYRITDVPFQAWLNTIARNHIVDTVRKERTHFVRSDSDRLYEVGANDKGFDRILSLEVIRLGFSALTGVQQRVLELRYVEGYDLGSTAQAIGRTRSATKSIHYRAIRTLRKILQESEDNVDTAAAALARA